MQNKTPSEALLEIRGVLDHITFLNKENGFTVARLLEDVHDALTKEKRATTVVGFLSEVSIGTTLSLFGDWIDDARFGRQFKVQRYTIVKPNTLVGMERYLGSGLIKGIGPGFAARIVKEFGLATLDVLDHEPDRLSEVAGLGAKRIDTVKKAWQDQQAVHQIMIFLQAHGISAAYAVKIYRTYGGAALKVVQENPYRLTEDIRGIGFKIADGIARSLGVPSSDMRRVRAGLLFALNEAAKEGHCYVEKEELKTLVSRLLDLSPVSSSLIESQIPSLVFDEKIVAEEERIFLAPFYFAEKGCAKKLIDLFQGTGLSAAYIQITEEQVRDQVSAKMKLTLAQKQIEAIHMSLKYRACVLTGGPGTGKSTILKGLLHILEKNGIRVCLAAPTGRAAKRLGEACGRDARTIHRLLEFDPSIMGFKKNAVNPLKAEMVIIDEASMMDILLTNSLLKAISQNASLLLVGDGDQLPSVGAGNVLKDIIGSGVVPVVHLDIIFRQSTGSLISLNGSLINQGKSLELLPGYKGEKDFYCIFRNEQEEIEKEIISLCDGRLHRKYGFDSIRDIQVLAPMRKGRIGTEALNNSLQETLNPKGNGLEIRGRRFRVGDKVMQIRNNYEKEVFNGDLGIISGVDKEEQSLEVLIDGRNLSYEGADLDELVLAYATTVHKSQGSEFLCVIMPLHTAHYTMLQRNLLYTAVTRGKRLVILVGNKKAINMAIRNNKMRRRNTFLKERLALLNE